MEILNFYTQGSMAKHKSIQRWFFFNCCIIAMLGITLFGLHAFQKHTQTILEKEKCALEHHIAAANPLIQQHMDFEHAQNLLYKKRENSTAIGFSKVYPQILSRIKQCTKNDIVLESISAQDSIIELQLSSTCVNNLLDYAQTFSKHPQTRDFYITALENKNNRFIAIMRNT